MHADHAAPPGVHRVGSPGFTPGVGGSGLIHDANPALGGQYRADYVNGRWRIEYLYC